MHFGKQRPTVGIDEVDFVKIGDREPSRGSGGCRPPTLAELVDPGSGEFPFEAESKFRGAVEKRDLQHSAIGKARRLPHVKNAK
jgi:hypothetical protein